MEFEIFKFENDELQVIRVGEAAFVALRPICDILELEWARQMRTIQDDPVLSSVVAKLASTGADGKQYEMLCLPLDYLNGWLFKINANRYEGERRAVIIRYQKECYRVLAEHFLPARRNSLPADVEKIIEKTIQVQFAPLALHVERAMEDVLLPTMCSVLNKTLPAAMVSYDKSIQCRKCQHAAQAAAEAVAKALLQERLSQSPVG